MLLRVDPSCLMTFHTDGMGYYDDGEEHVGVAEDSFDG